jgi:peptidoglycan/xylan/chitin deacetylase (PgdA/CDA1 family)
MLHRVLPKMERNAYSLNKDLAITPEKLEEFILFFKQKGYVFISLDELADWLDGKINIQQKFICLTFDDGYQDNLIHGLLYYIYEQHQHSNQPSTSLFRSRSDLHQIPGDH